jgi:hypothetical protein
MQGGSATLADVALCHGRQYQALVSNGEAQVISSLESRWADVEQPLLLLSLYLSPWSGRRVVVSMTGQRSACNRVLNLNMLRELVDFYGARWKLRVPDASRSFDVARAIAEWHRGADDSAYDWTQPSDSMDTPAVFWECRLAENSWSETAGSRSLSALARVALRLFSVLPNAADPERLFSLLGQIVTPSRTRLSDKRVTQLSTISADVRARRLTKESADRRI